MSDDPAARAAKMIAAADRLCKSADADLVVLVGGMYGDAADKLCRMIEKERSRENVVLIIGTFGGAPDVAYRISRILQNEFKRFTAVIDTHCKSAGTLLVIGAHELVMSNRGELGPLDIQVGKLDEPKERTSGLAPVQALKILQEQVAETYINLFKEWSAKLPIQTRTAVATAEATTSALFSKLYAQLEPVRLGEYQRAMSLMTEYGNRLLDGGGNLQDGKLDDLVTGYPDHSFAIDRHEAAELFKKVRTPNQEERDLLNLLEALFVVHLEAKEPFLFYHSAGAAPTPGGGSNNGTTQHAASGTVASCQAEDPTGDAGGSGRTGQPEGGEQPSPQPTAPRFALPDGGANGGRRRRK